MYLGKDQRTYSLATTNSTPMKHWTATLVFIICWASTDCLAMSRRGMATIRIMDGQPCFAISGESESKSEKLDFSSLVVIEAKRSSPEWGAPDEKLWEISVDPPGEFVAISLETCFPYGSIPERAVETFRSRPLTLNHPYIVSISARPKTRSIPTAGCSATFCLVRGTDGETTARAVTWDKAARRWRDDVCSFI